MWLKIISISTFFSDFSLKNSALRVLFFASETKKLNNLKFKIDNMKRIFSNAQIRLTTRIIQLAFAIELMFAIFYYLIPAFQMLFYGSVWVQFSWYFFAISILAITCFIYFGVLHPDSWLSPLFAVGLGSAVVIETYSELLKELEGLNAFLEISAVLTAFSICILYVLITSFIHYELLAHEGIIHLKKLKAKSAERRVYTKKEILTHILVGVVILSSGTLVYLGTAKDPMVNGVITIQPSSEPVEFAFWGQLNPDRYSTAQKIALNKHNVLIIGYDTPIWFENSSAERTKFMQYCQYWRDNYPNVRLMAVAHGIPGGFVWDGSAEGSIAFTRRIIETVIQENLTTVIGINTDQEKPQALKQSKTYKDRERNADATARWNQFLTEIKQAYPNRFEFQTTFDMTSIIDQLDGDNDLDVYVRNNVLTVPAWDEYAPMIYTAGGKNYVPNPISADKAHFELYLYMKILKDALVKADMGTKIGGYLGITNMSIFSRDNTVYWHNRPNATGYDALVTQALIAKHFGIRRLTTFILDTVPAGDDSVELMGGVFDSYGEDFMDRYNESVNGLDSVKPFEILSFSGFRKLGAISKDFVFGPGIGITMGIGVIIVYILLIGVQHKKYLKERDLSNAIR